jgi:hypothetical protein
MLATTTMIRNNTTQVNQKEPAPQTQVQDLKMAIHQKANRIGQY